MELFVVRHGDSPFTAATDHQRPLSELGEVQAAKSGAFIAQQGISTEVQIVCSDATRTHSTALIIAGKLGHCAVTAQAELYGARTGQWCEVIEHHQQLSQLILVGHNPTMSLLARHLFPLKAFQFQPACVAHFTLEIEQQGLRLPAQYKQFYSPHATSQ